MGQLLEHHQIGIQEIDECQGEESYGENQERTGELDQANSIQIEN